MSENNKDQTFGLLGAPMQPVSALRVTLDAAQPAGSTQPDLDVSRILSPPVSADEIGWLAHYRVLKLLGCGGMGAVFQAEDTHLQRNVALKIILPGYAANPMARDRFLREARACAALKNDHIVTIYQVSQDRDIAFLAMEYLQGQTLEGRLKEQGPLLSQEVIRIGREIVAGLAAAHASGLIHRDIKPANAWLEAPDGRVKLLDFGLARPMGSTSNLTQTGNIVGTPEFMSPEQARGEQLDGRSDLFSLGAVLYASCTGHSPFQGSSVMAILTALAVDTPRPLDQVRYDIPPGLTQLISRLLAKNPTDRPRAPEEVAAALASLAVPGFSKAKRRLPLVLAAGLIVLACGAFVTLWLVLRGTPASHTPDAASPELARPHLAATAPGVTATDITLGMSAPFSGPSKELGRGMQIGIETYLRYVNENPERVHGRRVKLLALDDEYEPQRCAGNMKEMIDKRPVFAFIGNVGTPTAEVALPIALEHKRILFGAFTGANLLRRDPPDRYVFNYRASYEEETAAIVNYLLTVRKVKPEQIAVFAQQDGYGDAGFNGVAKALRRVGFDTDSILRVGYPRNTTNVGAAVSALIEHKDRIKAIVMVPTYRPAAAFVKRISDEGMKPIFTTVSFVGSDALADALKEAGPQYAEGVIVTQVVPYFGSNATAVLQYREHLAQYYPQEHPGFVSLEGYIAAKLLCTAMENAGPELTTDTLIEAIETIRDLDLGLGTVISFGPSRHQGSHKVWATVLDANARFQNLDLD